MAAGQRELVVRRLLGEVVTEIEARQSVVAECRTWLGVPFHMNGMARPDSEGRGGGIDCLRLIWRSFCDAGVIEDPGGDPWPHLSVQRSQHEREERLVEFVERYAAEVTRHLGVAGAGPFIVALLPLPADIVLAKRPDDLCFAHAALVTEWPKVIHVIDRRGVAEVNIELLKRRWPKVELRFFDVWAKAAVAA